MKNFLHYTTLWSRGRHW